MKKLKQRQECYYGKGETKHHKHEAEAHLTCILPQKGKLKAAKLV